MSSSSASLPKASSSSILPDLECSICVKQGHGVHFGVVTCRACASFFSRSIAQQRIYKCLRGGNRCDIKREGGRKACRACRLQACILAGMRIEEGGNQISSLNSSGKQMQLLKPSYSKMQQQIHNSVEISEENAPTLFKFMQGYQTFLRNQRSAFLVKHPELAFQNIQMIEVDEKDIAHSLLEAKPLMFTLLNENVEPFGLMQHEQKIHLFEECFHQIHNLHRFFLTLREFPAYEDLQVMIAVGYVMDVGNMEEFYRKPMLPIQTEPIFQIKTTLIEDYIVFIKRFKSIQEIKEQDFCALMCIQLWNEADHANVLNDEMRQHKDSIIEEWLENLTTRFGGNAMVAGKFMAKLLCLLVELKTLTLQQREILDVYEIYQGVQREKMLRNS